MSSDALARYRQPQAMHTRRALISPLVWLSMLSVDALANDVAITILPASVLRVAAGSEIEMTLQIQASNSFDSTLFISVAAGSEYEVVSGPEVGCASITPLSGIRHVLFDPSVGNGEIFCHYRIHRAATSVNDLSFLLYANGVSGLPVAGARAVLGTTAELELGVQQQSFELLSDGRARGSAAITLWNSSTVPVGGVTAGFCLDNVFPEFSIDGTIPAGCGTADQFGGFCFDYRYGFALARADSNAGTTCMVELTSFAPYVNPLHFPIRLETSWLFNPENGGRLLNVRSENMGDLLLAADMLFIDGFE